MIFCPSTVWRTSSKHVACAHALACGAWCRWPHAASAAKAATATAVVAAASAAVAVAMAVAVAVAMALVAVGDVGAKRVISW